MNVIQFAKYILELEEKGEINEESELFLDIEGKEDYAKIAFTDLDNDVIIQTEVNVDNFTAPKNIKYF